MNKKLRSNRGSMLVLIIALVAVIIIPLFVYAARLGPFAISAQHAQNVVDAAALVAANDLSRIVINDPSFGYVSLSDHPATGGATSAQDGEPLPVLGINTLVGTLRQNAIVASNLPNSTMVSFVSSDVNSLQSTIKTFNSSLSTLLSNTTGTSTSVDMDGKAVNPVQDVTAFLKSNLPPGMQVQSVKLSLGWLKDGSDTNTPVPQPVKYAQLPADNIQDNNYEAFVSCPVGKNSFTFAGLGAQSHLVSSRKFQALDGAHICTIIKMDCTLLSADASQAQLSFSACSQPYSKADTAPSGAMTVRFAESPVDGIANWNQFLASGNFSDYKITTFDVINGDFPLEKNSQMRVNQQAVNTTTTQQFAQTLYDWLRNGRLIPHVDAILSMLSQPFPSTSNTVYTYTFNNDGTIARSSNATTTFARSVTAQGQQAVMADTKVKNGASAIAVFRDSVKNLSISNSKHAGRFLAGYPTNSVASNIDYKQLVKNFSKRNAQPSGLAADIEIGGHGGSSNAAKADVLSMHQRTANRRS